MPSSDLYDLIYRRRDVRSEFNGEPIQPDVLERVLAAAHAAPSVGHTQPWDFILVRDPETRGQFKQHVQSERELFDRSLDPSRQETFSRIKVEGIMESSLGIVVTYDAARGGSQVLGRHAIADAGLYSVCLCIQNLWLAATAESLGVGWVSFYQEDFLQELLVIPTSVRPVAWLCVGPMSRVQEQPDLERLEWRQKRPLTDAIHTDRYQPGRS